MNFIFYGLFSYIFLLVIVYALIEKIVFRPSHIDQEYKFEFKSPHQEIFIGDDNSQLKINALHFTVPNAKGCILYFHGNTGSLDRWGNAHKEFSKRGYDTFIIDYPGYGKSNKSSTEKTVYTAADMAYDWAVKRYSSDNIIIYGRSIGSGPASYIAKHKPAQQLILETPFYSMAQLLKHFAPFIFYLLPAKVSLNVFEHIDGIDMPITIVHGTKDKIVPFSSAIKLKPIIKESDRFLIIEGGGHNNMMEYAEVQKEIDRCLL